MREFLCLVLLAFVSNTFSQEELGKCRTVKDTMLTCHEATTDDLPKEKMEGVTWLLFVRSKVPVVKREAMKLYPALTDLHADSTSMEAIEEDAFYDLKDLNWVSVAGNKLSNLNPDLFKEARNLYYVNMSSNPDLVIPKSSPFLNSPKLNWLDISYSGIQELYPETFKKLRGLKVLSLAGNKLKTLPPGIFTPLQNLYSLDLSNNQFQVLNSNLMKDLKHISLYLGGNPWDCDCLLYPMIEWAKTRRMKDEVRCATPDNKLWSEFAGTVCEKPTIEVAPEAAASHE